MASWSILTRPFTGDAQLALVTARDEADALELARHDFAHVLAEAVQALFPGTQITFGPATDDGFYMTFRARPRGPFTEDDLPAIEERCARSSRRQAAAPRGGGARRPDRRLEGGGRKLQGRMGRRTARRARN
jgi:threonyl-tRNA synthetase